MAAQGFFGQAFEHRPLGFGTQSLAVDDSGAGDAVGLAFGYERQDMLLCCFGVHMMKVKDGADAVSPSTQLSHDPFLNAGSQKEDLLTALQACRVIVVSEQFGEYKLFIGQGLTGDRLWPLFAMRHAIAFGWRHLANRTAKKLSLLMFHSKRLFLYLR